MTKNVSDLTADELKHKRVLVRVDFNVPLDESGKITEDSRIVAALPTIELLCDAGAKVILVSHLGRPKGQKNEKLSLKPVAERLAELLSAKEVKVSFVDDTVGDKAKAAISALKEGEVCLLENIRFESGEEKNDPDFARKLADLADLYVNDAFGTAHRAHASTEGVVKYLSPAVAGLLMHKEVSMLGGALDNPVRPVATIVGGAKVSSKIGVLDNLLEKVDYIIIGGAMAFTFLKARGLSVGKSLVEDDRLEYCKKLEEKAAKLGVKIILPVDVVIADELKGGIKTETVSVENIPANKMGLDVGPETVKLTKEALEKSKTILWNGPLGVFEIEEFAEATFAIVDELVELTGAGAITIVGGGDSVSALKARKVAPETLTHVSTGGGASLEFLEGIELPGIKCLDSVEVARACN